MVISGTNLKRGFLCLILPDPGGCYFCGRRMRPLPFAIARRYLCGGCLKRIPFVTPPVCRLCGKPLRGPGGGELLCGDCLGVGRFFRLARSVGLYDGLLRLAIHSLKFGGRREFARPLGGLLAERILHEGEMLSSDVMLPVPLHPERLAARGYNQAALLAGETSRWTGIPVLEDILVRTRLTPSQSGLSRTMRKRNPRRSFVVARPEAVSGKKVLLVDDILTTGSTADECARALLWAGSREVLVLTVASGIIEGECVYGPRGRAPGP